MSSLNNLRFGFNDIIDYLRTSFCIFARIKTKDYIMAEKHTLSLCRASCLTRRSVSGSLSVMC